MRMRTTVHSNINESLFESHYGRKPRTEIPIYLNITPIKQKNVSAELEVLQVYTFSTGSGKHDQLGMQAPRKLKEDVSKNFAYQFLEKITIETNLKVCTTENHKQG